MAEDDDLSRFSEEEKIKPIDHSLPAKKDLSALNVDPIVAQQERERKEEAARRERVRQRDTSIPEHMVALVPDVAKSAIGKGEQIDLLSRVPSLRILHAGVGWDQKSQESEAIDIDLSVFLLDRKDMTQQDEHFVFYNQLIACDGAVKHEGDNRTGAGEGDDESVFMDLNGISFDIFKIVFVLSIYDETAKGDHFGLIRNMHFRLVNREDSTEICRFNLPEGEYENTNAIQVAMLKREGAKWIFETLGVGMKHGLSALATQYGIIVREVQSTG